MGSERRRRSSRRAELLRFAPIELLPWPLVLLLGVVGIVVTYVQIALRKV